MHILLISGDAGRRQPIISLQNSCAWNNDCASEEADFTHLNKEKALRLLLKKSGANTNDRLVRREDAAAGGWQVGLPPVGRRRARGGEVDNVEEGGRVRGH